MTVRKCLMVLAVCFATTAHTAFAQPPEVTSPLPMSDDAVWKGFSASLADYVAMRERISQELPGLKVTDKPAEFVAASDSLARAVERANPKAPQGRFFTPEAAIEIRRRFDEYARSHDMSEILAPIAEERATVGGLNIYTRFPLSSPMASMPPGLLERLPPLPRTLEYRLVGRVLILRDIDAALVIDYLPNAFSVTK